MSAEGHEVEGLFYNPNIYPEQEHQIRLQVAQQVADHLSFPLTAIPYDPGDWDRTICGLESDPEGGRRCTACYRLRLHKTWLYTVEKGRDAFTTTLTMSRNKPASLINAIGEDIGGHRFLQSDFKKKDGDKRSGELARDLGLYRQHYCGCKFSMLKANR